MKLTCDQLDRFGRDGFLGLLEAVDAAG